MAVKYQHHEPAFTVHPGKSVHVIRGLEIIFEKSEKACFCKFVKISMI